MALAPNGNTGCSGMRVLREVEGQDERFSPRVLDFHAAAIQRGLGDKTDLGIDFAKLHVLVISHFELSNSAAAAVRVEQGGALRVEIGLGAGCKGEAENGGLLIA